MSRILRLTRDLGGRVLGPYATLHGYSSDDAEALVAATDGAVQPGVTESMLFAQAPQIYGGTDEIQTQHPRRAGARPAQGARHQQGQAVPGDPEERLARGSRSAVLKGAPEWADPVEVGRFGRRGG